MIKIYTFEEKKFMKIIIEMMCICLVVLVGLILVILMFKDLFKESNKHVDYTSILNDQYLIIRFDENNEILMKTNSNFIKDDIIRIIQEVTKIETID
jgi:hypothetical protein